MADPTLGHVSQVTYVLYAEQHIFPETVCNHAATHSTCDCGEVGVLSGGNR